MHSRCVQQYISSSLAYMAQVDHQPIVTGIRCRCTGRFGHAELLDDITDHWDASTHLQERADFIRGMQAIVRKKGVRVSFLGGDVHVCAVGRFYTHPKVCLLGSILWGCILGCLRHVSGMMGFEIV